MARRANLQMISDEQISSPLEVYEWTSKDSRLPNIPLMYKDSKDYEKAEEKARKKLQFESEDIFFLPKLQNCELCET